MLLSHHTSDLIEAGCDEAGRGCLAGPVFAAAVVFPKNYCNEDLKDSKQLNQNQRNALRETIETDALAWAVASVSQEEIDKINILNASVLAMHRAIEQLKLNPEFLLIDGNRFKPYKKIPHQTIVKGDGKYLSIAAASVLAKTYRDSYMLQIHNDFPNYGWLTNQGYPTKKHYDAIEKHGITSHHRKTFKLIKPVQLQLINM
ncbi:MAG: ribonuclease HII [Bacteroidales bacterium]|jgi:ribonuclease HII|nr:ribonuclease HII [Bacteroidales bacterium]